MRERNDSKNKLKKKNQYSLKINDLKSNQMNHQGEVSHSRSPL